MNDMTKNGNVNGNAGNVVKTLQGLGGFARRETLLDKKFGLSESEIRQALGQGSMYGLEFELPHINGRDTEIYVLKNSDVALKRLENLAERAAYLCGGNESQQPGMYFSGLKEGMGGDADKTIMGISYALRTGKIGQFGNLGTRETGPLYVAVNTLAHYRLTNADQIFHYIKKEDK